MVDRSPRTRLRRFGIASVGALMVELAFGLATNALVHIPVHDPWGGAHPGWVLYVHAAIGFALLVNGAMVVNTAIDSGVPHALGAAVVGVLSIIAAIGAGIAFVNTGAQHQILSVAMALAFVVALAAYIALWQAARRTRVA
ncbi:hypothetical protein [Acidimicrobium ferrooxidans]|nr:hypothetical protein [Acidimicrobium ferrooxidans]